MLMSNKLSETQPQEPTETDILMSSPKPTAMNLTSDSRSELTSYHQRYINHDDYLAFHHAHLPTSLYNLAGIWNNILTLSQHHAPLKSQVRQLNLLEHHSHKLLQEVRYPFIQDNLNAYTTQFKLPVPPGFVVTTPEQAKQVASVISIFTPACPNSRSTETNMPPDGPSMIKAQVLAGGRGKGKFNSDGKSGVRLVDS